MLQEGSLSFENTALFCFFRAYKICESLVKSSHTPLWKLPDFYKLTNYGTSDADFNKVVQAVTLTIVLILTEHLNKEWKLQNQQIRNKIKDFILHSYLSNETLKMLGNTEIVAPGAKLECLSAYKLLYRNTDIDIELPFSEFSDSDKHKSPTQTGGETTKHSLQETDELKAKIKELQNQLKKQPPTTNTDACETLRQEIKQLKQEKTDMIIELLSNIFYGDIENAQEFLQKIKGMSDSEITDTVHEWVKERKISDRSYKRDLWRILHAAKLYSSSESNWNTALRNHS